MDYTRKMIGQIRDIEKIGRNLVLQKIYPSSIYHLYKSICLIQTLNQTIVSSSPELYDYLCSEFSTSDKKDYIDTTCRELIQYIDSQLIIEKCSGISSIHNYDESFIQTGVSSVLDEYIEKQTTNIQLFSSIREHLNLLFYQPEGNCIQYVKEHETEKSGLSMQITKTRGATLKKILANSATPFLKINENVCIFIKDIQFKHASGTNDEIDTPLLSKISRDILLLKDKINEQLTIVYLSFIKDLEQKGLTSLENLAIYISKLDVLQSKAYVAREYKYCKPIIVGDANKSFVDARELRHVLIEHIQQNEIYVANDIVVGNGLMSKQMSKQNTEYIDGILLYGTNAVGKTSMIRALGISIVMAQCGMFVPCSQFFYKPYTAIFSRILGNDNIFKGLSTFAVEMSELRIILKMADKNSLILGDELCSGTETESALSIFMAGLMDLHSKECSFLFATHFHEIVHHDEIKALNRLAMKHLAVYYDRELDCLVYDRKLKDGSGTRMYGLEVCKSLHLPDEFLEKAYQLRTKYYPDTKGELGFESTTYNAKKIRGMCEMCKNHIGEEVHHLQEQKEADSDGFISHFHKNHPANLMNICEKCHDKLHSNNTNMGQEKESLLKIPDATIPAKKKVVRKKTTRGYIVTETP
jgi:DNA mismatch repair protein MutS